jgi:hypothetical protein
MATQVVVVPKAQDPELCADENWLKSFVKFGKFGKFGKLVNLSRPPSPIAIVP